MPDIQQQINSILNNPEALKQVQSLGEQLGLSGTLNQSAPKPSPPPKSNAMNDDMLKTVTRLAPLMQSVKGDDDTTRLLNALRPFLGEEKQEKLDKAEKMMKVIKILPLLKDNGVF